MKPKINISVRDNPGSILRMSIGLLEKLDYPQYVRILINQETKEVAIQPTHKEDSKGLRVLYTKNASMMGSYICSKLTITKIYELCGFEVGQCYRTKDYKVADGIYVFDLKKAINATRKIVTKSLS